MSGLRGAAAIAGIGETALGHLPGSNVMDLCAEAARLCIEDAGIAKDDIDGLIVFGSRVEDHTRFQRPARGTPGHAEETLHRCHQDGRHIQRQRHRGDRCAAIGTRSA